MQIQPDNAYRHSQEGQWSLILLAFGSVSLVTAWFARQEPVDLVICPLVGVLMLVLAASFHHLTVADEGDHLAIQFGPLPLARKTIRYDDIRDVELGRTLLLDGWGIHMSIRGGWVWNIWGMDCVVIHLKRGVVRVGTDDASNLAEFLKSKIGTA